MPHQPASAALSRFRVIDLTQVRAGPTACRQLADWGADVVQVQMPEHMRGDDTLGGQEGSDYQYTHRNKRSITLNLKEPEGIALLKQLIAKADVVVENFRPDVKFRLGIDYESLKKDNPGLVYASISGFGQTGPLAARPGFDQIAQGMGGLMSVTGLVEQGPMRVGIPIADLCAGIFAAQGILVALLEREKSGQGQWLHTSLLESMVYMMDFQTSRWLIDEEVATQAGNFHPTSIPTGVYKARDGYMNIAVFGSKIWERFCDILEAPQWVTDPRYHDKPSRSVHRDALNAEINERLAKQDRAALDRTLERWWGGLWPDQQHGRGVQGTASPALEDGERRGVGAPRAAALGGATGAAGAHAQHHRPRRTAPWGAQRRNSGRIGA
jgi:crotonobetainyl-CoA:carnitine CoA-transferase CaiB-like acyl-CoA transferase